MLTLLGSGCRWEISVSIKEGKSEANQSNSPSFLSLFFPLKDLPRFLISSPFLNRILIGGSYFFRSGFFSFFFFWCLGTSLWYFIGVFTISRGTMGRTSGHTLILDFSLLFRLFSLLGVFVRRACPGRRRDPPPQSLQKEPSGNSASDPGASWHGHQRQR